MAPGTKSSKELVEEAANGLNAGFLSPKTAAGAAKEQAPMQTHGLRISPRESTSPLAAGFKKTIQSLMPKPAAKTRQIESLQKSACWMSGFAGHGA